MKSSSHIRNWLRPILVSLLAGLIGLIALVENRHLPLTLDSLNLNQSIPYQFSDSEYYIKIAEGRISEVASPYCKRVLYPWLAGELSRRTHQSLAAAFLQLNFLAFLFAALCLAATLQKLGVSPWWAVLPFLTPLPLECLQRAYLPDLAHVALVSLFFLLLAWDLEKWALVVLFVAFLTRDNTVILTLAVCIIGWFFRRKQLLWGGLLVLVAGLACESRFVHMGLPNRHHLPEFLYLALFVPCSFFGNVLGIVFWTNVGGADGIPFWQWHIPHMLQLGADRDVFASYNWHRQLETGGALTTLFGCGPYLLWRLRKAFAPKTSWPVVVWLAFGYGLFSYFLGTSVGRTGMFRLIAYSWPLFWIALPYFITTANLKFAPWQAFMLITLSIIDAWMANVGRANCETQPPSLWLLLIPASYALTAILLRGSVEKIPKAAGSSPLGT